jgi:hypothetical protein
MNASSQCCVEQGADPWKRPSGDGDRRWPFVMTAFRSAPVSDTPTFARGH